MKNIRINKNLFKKGKLALIAIPVSLTIAFSSCSLTPDGERARYKNVENGTDITTENEITNDIESIIKIDIDYLNHPLKDVGDINLRDKKINYSNYNNIEFKTYLDNIKVVYNYEDIYNFEKALNEYNKLNLTNSHNSNLKSLNQIELQKIILENNELYKEKNKSSIYKKLSSKELSRIIETIITTVNDFIYSNPNISSERIICVLSDLKIFVQKSSMNNAFVTNDNCLVLSPNMLKFANTINGEGTDEDVLKHEIIHLLQKGCNCDLNQNDNLKRNFGICYNFKNIEINSLDFTWFYEASAEKNMVNYTKHEPLVYKNMIGYLESLSIVNLIKDDYKVNDTEKLCFKRNLNDLFNYFGATTQNEKKEVLNLMYSIEVMQQAPSDFYELLEKKTGQKKDSKLIDEVNYTVKNSICETLTKYFYKNLSDNIVNKSISLGDVFYLISIFENDINNHILYSSENKYNYNKEFINTYLNIQEGFFLQLSRCLGCGVEEIENMYNNYNSKIKVGNEIVNNYSLSVIGKEKIEYLSEREEALKNVVGPTISLVSNEICNKESKKMYN